MLELAFAWTQGRPLLVGKLQLRYLDSLPDFLHGAGAVIVVTGAANAT